MMVSDRKRASSGTKGSAARLVRPGIFLLIVAVFATAAVNLGQALLRLDERATRNASLDYADRQVAGGNGVVGSQALAYQARAWIPEGAEYTVVVGPALQGQTELTPLYAADYLRYFLFPRVQDADASWVLCYGCDETALRGSYERLFDAGDGMTLGRLR